MRIMFIVNDLGVNEPFGPMILSAILKHNGHETTLGVLAKEDVGRKIASWRPDLLAYSMMSVDMKDMKKFHDELRRRKTIFTILGGPHPTLEPGVVADPNIDAVCVGEGDAAFLEVVTRLEQGRDLRGIPNILTGPDDELILGKLITDLDALPFMDRELVYSYPEMARFGIKGVWTSRGCVYPCPYCFNNRYNALYKGKGPIVRRRSVDSVIAETKQLMTAYRVAFVRIQDDVFIHRANDWLKEFADKWSAEIGLPFYCLLRSETVTDEMAYYLKKAGCFSICMSIESGHDGLRRQMLRRHMDKKDLVRAFAIFKRHGINVYANTMLAMPFSTLEHDIESLDFAIKVKPEMPNFSILMPYPGTDLGDYCREVGVYDPKKEDINYGMRNMSPLSCFTYREKRAQYNLCQLAIVAVKFPRLRNVIVKRMIHWPPNKAFFLTHYFFAVTSYGRKIFYFKHTIKEYVELFVRTMKHYLYDFTKREKPAAAPTSATIHTRPFPTLAERRLEMEKCMAAMAASRVYSADKSTRESVSR